ncbi:MAG: hypothetical protein AAF434_01370 [Pseudomonadota bacterium]
MEFLFADRFSLLEVVLTVFAFTGLTLGVVESLRTGKLSALKGRKFKMPGGKSRSPRCEHDYEYIGMLQGFSENDHGGSIFRHRCKLCGQETLFDAKEPVEMVNPQW